MLTPIIGAKSGVTMSNRKFDQFLESQKRPVPMDASARRSWWLGRLNDFYTLVESFLQEYIHAQKISTARIKLQIHEEQTGAYDAEALSIFVGSNEVQLRPVGTYLIGARGRVDLVGPMGKVHFVLVEEDANSPTDGTSPRWEWKISIRLPKIKYFNINREIFLDTLMEVMNGEG